MLSTHTFPGVNDIKATVLEVWGLARFSPLLLRMA